MFGKDDIKIYSLYESVNNSDGVSIWYHAGPRILTKETIRFDLGAMGFHLGTKKQIEYISKGTYKKGMSGNLKVSEFKLYDNYNDLETETIEEDMPWEQAPDLAVYLCHVGIMNVDDVKNFLNSIGIDSDSEDEDDQSYFIALDKIKMYGENYHPSDDLFRITGDSYYYKNTEYLEKLRNILVNEYRIGAIKYQNVGEGMFSEYTYSICLLDKSFIVDPKEDDKDSIIIDSKKKDELKKRVGFDYKEKYLTDHNLPPIDIEDFSGKNFKIFNDAFEYVFGLKYIRTIRDINYNYYSVYKITDRQKYNKIKKYI